MSVAWAQLMWRRAGPIALALLCLGDVASAAPRKRRELKWEWARFRPEEYVATSALLVGAFTARFAPGPSDVNWRDGVLFDRPFYDGAYPTSETSRKAWKVAGDVVYGSSYFWGLADPLIAGATHGWDVGSQMLLVNVEAYATYAALLWGSQALIHRRRPESSPCDGKSGPGSAGGCGSDASTRAFIGGHTGFVATTASLTCLHHVYMPLYGGGFRDIFPCAFWIGGTMVAFSARAVLGDHYLSDNLFGVGIGGLSGFVLPWLLHYRLGPRPWTMGSSGGLRITGASLGPSELGDGATVRLRGSW